MARKLSQARRMYRITEKQLFAKGKGNPLKQGRLLPG